MKIVSSAWFLTIRTTSPPSGEVRHRIKLVLPLISPKASLRLDAGRGKGENSAA